MNHKYDASIIKKAGEFSSYLDSLFSSDKEKYFWDFLVNNSRSFVVGGVIKDYILNKDPNHRDIDIVIDEITDEVKKFIENYLIRKNQFGGYKLKVGKIVIDLWEIRNTWGLKNKGVLNFDDVYKYIPETSFFNLTAVLFSVNDSKFFMEEKFNNFLQDEVLDIVYEENPLPSLCILKTYELNKKFNLKLSSRLKKYIVDNFDNCKNDFLGAQIKHYGRKRYSIKELLHFKNLLETKKYTRKNKKILKRSKNELNLFNSNYLNDLNVKNV